MDKISKLADNDEARLYSPESDDTIQPKFVFVSPLAEGADRVAAEEALRLGFRLKATLPFARAEYKADFRETVDEFQRLLQQADSVLELDGDRSKYRERSYEAAGRFVVNNSDLLIAVWDGEPSKGRGGTGDIVELAVDLGVPVVQVPVNGIDDFRLSETRLHLSDNTAGMAVDLEVSGVQLSGVGAGEPRLIETWLQLRRPDLRPYEDGLHRLIKRTVLPPPAPERWGLDFRRPALKKYLQEKVPGAGRRRTIFRWFGPLIIWLLTHIGGFLELLVTFRNRETLEPSRSISAAPAGHGDTAENWWTRSYVSADLLSRLYGARYRSCYVTILLLALLALVLAVWRTAGPNNEAIPYFELVFLLIILGLFISSWLFRWHQRWISYRLLAELCRKQRVLALLGRSLPRWEIEHLGSAEIEHLGSEEIERLGSEADTGDEAWVGWYFTAMARAAPFPRDIGRGALEHLRQAGVALLNEQIGYHVDRGRRGKAGFALHALSLVCFLFTVVCVAFELKHYSPWGPAIPWGIFAAIFPTAAAFFFGIGAYAEFELLADQSARMKRVMCDARDEIEGLRFDRPLASQDLGARLFRAATLMMQDIRGWAQLFRVKHVETH